MYDFGSTWMAGSLEELEGHILGVFGNAFWHSDAGDIDGALDMIDALSVEPGLIFEMNSVGDIRVLGEMNVFARIADRPEPELVDANYLFDQHYKELTDKAIRLIEGTSPVSELGMFRSAEAFNEYAEEYGWEDGEDA